MKKIKYFIQFFFIILLFIIFKILGLNLARKISSSIFKNLGPLFRSYNLTNKNIQKAMPNLASDERRKIILEMWRNYGKIFAEYAFIGLLSNEKNFSKNITIQNLEVLEDVKNKKKPVIFISGHFNNFELMALTIQRAGVNLAAIYRPLNNFFLNPIMEKIRKKYICKKQIKKGISGTKEILKEFKSGTSIALMIDQRVSQGVKSNFFGTMAFTTTIPAQFVKKYNAIIIPVYIERADNNHFVIRFSNKIEFDKDITIQSITDKLNKILEKMILKNPTQWIWTHNRWR